MSKKTEELTEIIEEALQEEEEELYWLDWGKQGSRWRLLVYLQSERGVGLKNCADISYKLSAELDSSGLIEKQYDLEVSSPGLERPLMTADHYRGAIDEKIQVNTYGPIENRREIKGKLKNYIEDENGDYVLVSLKEKTIEIPLEQISKASVKADIDF